MKLLGNTNKIDIRIEKLEIEVRRLISIHDKLLDRVLHKEFFTAIGMPYVEESNKRLILLVEAKNRGFFDINNCFAPVKGAWGDNAFFTHHYSNIVDNYCYAKSTDTLCIPAIGVKGNMSFGNIHIYANGKWSNLTLKNK